MNYINEKDVLSYYLELIRKDDVSFLIGKEDAKKALVDNINELIKAENLHDRITLAKTIWKLLFETSLSSIDSDKSGYDTLFKYFDEYVEFEELIFASDSFYRDHTLHCLWVYFLGEYLYNCEDHKYIIKPMLETVNTLETIISEMKELNFSQKQIARVENIIDTIPDPSALRCVSALTHDLGYPLKKIKKINTSIKKILPFYGIDNFNEFSFDYQSIHLPFITEFIKLMALEISISISKPADATSSEYNEFVLDAFKIENNLFKGLSDNVKRLGPKIYEDKFNRFQLATSFKRNKSYELLYSQDMENYQHGLMSAYLLLRHLGIFKNIEMISNSLSDLTLSNNDSRRIYALSEIFKGISNHTCSGFKIRKIDSSVEFLSFIDEIEEFSRISRANQNRQFINEFCKTSIESIDNCFTINFVFDNTEIDNLDPERAFKGRCSKMLQLLDVPNLDKDFHIKINCIGQLPTNNKTYSLEIKRNYVLVSIDGEKQHIPSYLKSREFYTTEEYATLS